MRAHRTAIAEVAELADYVGLLLTWDANARQDLQELGKQLRTLAVSADDAVLLARSARVPLSLAISWCRATAARCTLAAAMGENQGELLDRLVAISWAWGPLPKGQHLRLQEADEDALHRSTRLGLELARSKELVEG